MDLFRQLVLARAGSCPLQVTRIVAFYLPAMFYGFKCPSRLEYLYFNRPLNINKSIFEPYTISLFPKVPPRTFSTVRSIKSKGGRYVAIGTFVDLSNSDTSPFFNVSVGPSSSDEGCLWARKSGKTTGWWSESLFYGGQGSSEVAGRYVAIDLAPEYHLSNVVPKDFWRPRLRWQLGFGSGG